MEKQMKFIDANIVIKAFTEDDDQESCRKLLSSEFVTNTLVLVEAFNAISRIKNDRVAASNSIKSLFKANCIIVDLNRNLLFESLKRIDKYNLDFPDLIHYTSALTNNCSEIVSFDKDFDNTDLRRIEP